MGKDDIEARPAIADEIDDSGKGHVEVGRENLHSALPPHESYEGHHRFDPELTWTAEEERRVVRKTDIKLMTWLCVMVSTKHLGSIIDERVLTSEQQFFGLQLDRGNLSNTLADDLLDNLGMNTDHYNNVRAQCSRLPP